MGLIERIQRVFRANLNSFMSSAEDPEKIMEGVVMEMQDNLLQLRQAVAQAIATQKRIERQTAQADSTALEWYSRAQLALQQDNESLAREALTKRRAYLETSTALSTQIEQQKTVVTKMKDDMRKLEQKITEVKTKKDMYIARARSAQASYRLQEMLSEVSNTDSLKAFERMEEKVLQLEAKSVAIAVSNPTSLESNNDVDAELIAIKQQLLTEEAEEQQVRGRGKI
ncbi:MAG: PspA/IM30 family protein [Rhizonema sp. NSF051]|nr:PspA/IM30 family protein [Rhizonema sp. NSF051]